MKKVIFIGLAIVFVMLLSGEFRVNDAPSLPLATGSHPVQVGRYLNLRVAITLADGEDTTITKVKNSAEIWINPNGGTLKYEDFADSTKYFIIDTLLPIPCQGIDSLKISNDSGESVTFTPADNML